MTVARAHGLRVDDPCVLLARLAGELTIDAASALDLQRAFIYREHPERRATHEAARRSSD